jgi:5-methylcytosine-specific restriction endonuclease McrBC GTP-binding regulatory subunit McrB
MYSTSCYKERLNFENTCISRMGVQQLIKKFLKTGSLTNLQKNYREDLPNSAEEVKQRIRNAVALLTIEEIRNSYKNFDVGLNYAQRAAES